MTILLYNDGRLVIDDGNPIEGNSLEGLVACVSDPQSGDTLKFDGKQWVAGAAASGLPAVTSTDNGKVLTVVEGEWAPAAGGGGGAYVAEFEWDNTNKYYVSVDDANDIFAQFEAGKSIVFHAPESRYCGETYIQPSGAEVGTNETFFHIDSNGIGNIIGCQPVGQKVGLNVYID